MFSRGFLGGSVVKNLLVNAGNAGSVPGWGRSLGEGNGNPLLYSCLGNPMGKETWATVHGVIKSRTQLSNYNNDNNKVFSKCGPLTAVIHISGGLAQNANFGVGSLELWSKDKQPLFWQALQEILVHTTTTDVEGESVHARYKTSTGKGVEVEVRVVESREKSQQLWYLLIYYLIRNFNKYGRWWNLEGIVTLGILFCNVIPEFKTSEVWRKNWLWR